ncbi:MAG: hypothetical protein COT25_02450 [Candidatus Kerfeldbacteria bacterium CG08_land_8_20_14_0_20_42_7]|uniref:Uncharacterized protein n=1 Tax=Candidatus Kerfeldbacteria bacterium CG08_land_8_20_14_0_20_42_7 TaxID=2014245 RepID=A0A2H0YUW4_9BACT|nr:MAG: hypothetical protein COT25_02450 [Candidatus Kerfeldbacteria bacterium CG08_land_8_20_14_0_20_42_7]
MVESAIFADSSFITDKNLIDVWTLLLHMYMPKKESASKLAGFFIFAAEATLFPVKTPREKVMHGHIASSQARTSRRSLHAFS